MSQGSEYYAGLDGVLYQVVENFKARHEIKGDGILQCYRHVAALSLIRAIVGLRRDLLAMPLPESLGASKEMAAEAMRVAMVEHLETFLMEAEMRSFTFQ